MQEKESKKGCSLRIEKSIIQDTVNHFIFACSLFRDFVIENLFAEI